MLIRSFAPPIRVDYTVVDPCRVSSSLLLLTDKTLRPLAERHSGAAIDPERF